MRPWPIDKQVLFLPLGLVQILQQNFDLSVSDKAKVLLHLLSLGFVVSIDMLDDNLGIAMDDN